MRTRESECIKCALDDFFRSRVEWMDPERIKEYLDKSKENISIMGKIIIKIDLNRT